VGYEGEMSQEKVLKTLVSLGLTLWEAKVYIFLSKRGSTRVKDASKALKISKQRLYPILKSLKSKGIVNSTLERPARFSAVPFEKVLDSFLKAKIDQAQRIQKNKSELLEDWQSIALAKSESSPGKFTVIEGRLYIYSKIQQMMQNTKEQISFVATVPSLARADLYGLFDSAFNHPSRSKIKFRFLTDLSEQNANAIKALLRQKPKSVFSLEGRTPDLGLKLCPRMVIRDREETVFFIDSGIGKFESEQDDVCLWTNCKSLVCAFLAMFEDLWRNSTNIELKIDEIETGRLPPQTQIISDAQTASEKYQAEVDSAENEILVITSSEGLVEFWKSVKTVRKCTQRGVSIKIMAPITNENMEPARQLLRYCEVRHVSASYLGATIIDQKHLFQFKEHPTGQTETGRIGNFENTFYTNDLDYVKKTWNMLKCIWKSAPTPSTLTLDAIVGNIGLTIAPLSIKTRNYIKKVGSYTILNEKPPGTITEKDVLNKIIHAKKYPVKDVSMDVDRLYATTGLAVVHPPNYFNLPDTMIFAFHVEKQSSLGEEDALMIFLWLETPKGYTYVPVAIVGDNPEAQEHWKKSHLGTPAGQNVQLFKKDEIQIRVHANNLYAAWTVPIQLYPSRYVLPPACLLLEAYGEVKTVAYTVVPPSGFRSVFEQNYFDAFVTFIHPSSKYQGPGTDGFFVRDLVATTYPPSNSKENV
jgi:sugar-specific transcriptional regulator TrmB